MRAKKPWSRNRFVSNQPIPSPCCSHSAHFIADTVEMGRVRNSRRRTSKNKEYKKHHDTKRRRRDIDQIQDDVAKEKDLNAKIEFEIDEDLPGLGQCYCTPCGRHFHDEATLTAHQETKLHKRRLQLYFTDIFQFFTSFTPQIKRYCSREVYSHGSRDGSGQNKRNIATSAWLILFSVPPKMFMLYIINCIVTFESVVIKWSQCH